MKRLPYLLIVLLLSAIPLAAQSKSKPKIGSSTRTFYRVGKIESNRPFYRPLKPVPAGQINRALVTAIGAEKVEMLVARARYYLAAGLEDGAQREFDRALAVDPDDEAFVARVASVISATGIDEECEKVTSLTTDFLAKYPKSDRVYMERAKAKACLRNFEGAFDDVSMAVGVDTQNRDYWRQRRLYIGQFLNSDYAQVARQREIDELESLSAASAPQPLRPLGFPRDLLAAAYIARSFAYRKLGEFELELSDLNRAAAIWPEQYLSFRATAYKERKMYAEAIADLSRAISVNTASRWPIANIFSLYQFRAETYLLMEKFDEAISDYQKCMEMNPRNTAFYESKIAVVKQRALLK